MTPPTLFDPGRSDLSHERADPPAVVRCPTPTTRGMSRRKSAPPVAIVPPANPAAAPAPPEGMPVADVDETPPRHAFNLVLVAIDEPDWPPAIRVRLLLKHALRSLSLRCHRATYAGEDDVAGGPIDFDIDRPEPAAAEDITELIASGREAEQWLDTLQQFAERAGEISDTGPAARALARLKSAIHRFQHWRTS